MRRGVISSPYMDVRHNGAPVRNRQRSGNLDCVYKWIAWGAVEATISVYVAILSKNILEIENSLDGLAGHLLRRGGGRR